MTHTRLLERFDSEVGVRYATEGFKVRNSMRFHNRVSCITRSKKPKSHFPIVPFHGTWVFAHNKHVSIKSKKESEPRVSALPVPRICIMLVNSRAPSFKPGPIKWGTIPGLVEFFDRGADEPEQNFLSRLIDACPDVEDPPGYIYVTIHAGTMKPDVPART